MRLKSIGMGYFLAIPDALSLLNLVFGFLAILMTLDHHLTIASLCILVALVFDSVDGWVSRKLERVDSFGFGKNMDSLADIVSFGLAPAVILYSLTLGMSDWASYLIGIVCVVVLVAGMFRLARYNVIADRIMYNGFIGFPIPGTALILVSYYLSGLFNLTIAAILMLFASYLMISTISYPKMENKYVIGLGALMILILISPLNIYLYGVNLPALVIFIIALVYMFKIFLEFFIDTETPVIDKAEASKKVSQARESTENKVSNSFSAIAGLVNSIKDNVNQVTNADFSKDAEETETEEEVETEEETN